MLVYNNSSLTKGHNEKRKQNFNIIILLHPLQCIMCRTRYYVYDLMMLMGTFMYFSSHSQSILHTHKHYYTYIGKMEWNIIMRTNVEFLFLLFYFVAVACRISIKLIMGFVNNNNNYILFYTILHIFCFCSSNNIFSSSRFFVVFILGLLVFFWESFKDFSPQIKGYSYCVFEFEGEIFFKRIGQHWFKIILSRKPKIISRSY